MNHLFLFLEYIIFICYSELDNLDAIETAKEAAGEAAMHKAEAMYEAIKDDFDMDMICSDE